MPKYEIEMIADLDNCNCASIISSTLHSTIKPPTLAGVLYSVPMGGWLLCLGSLVTLLSWVQWLDAEQMLIYHFILYGLNHLFDLDMVL